MKQSELKCQLRFRYNFGTTFGISLRFLMISHSLSWSHRPLRWNSFRSWTGWQEKLAFSIAAAVDGARVRRGQWDICSAGVTQWKHCCRDNARYHQSITGLHKSKDRDDLCGFGGLKRAELLKNGKKMTAVTASLWLAPRNFVWQEESGQIGTDFVWLPSPCSLTPTKS